MSLIFGIVINSLLCRIHCHPPIKLHSTHFPQILLKELHTAHSTFTIANIGPNIAVCIWNMKTEVHDCIDHGYFLCCYMCNYNDYV